MLNLGLLHPRNASSAPLPPTRRAAPVNSVEGFVRQVIGWREFINGAYWHAMPGYKDVTTCSDPAHSRLVLHGRNGPELPAPGDPAGVGPRLAAPHSAAHGRGEFLLIAGIDPQAALRWYLEMTVDAYDWVMVPNALGIILYADGGFHRHQALRGGRGYIHKMSNYCEGCRYSPLKKTGPDACPFNALYWDFHARHADLLRDNPRVSRTVQTWEARSPEDQHKMMWESAAKFLASM